MNKNWKLIAYILAFPSSILGFSFIVIQFLNQKKISSTQALISITFFLIISLFIIIKNALKK
jgi:hypothetical protein